jgi:hypothetical protein
LLEKPGVHTIRELEQALRFNSTMALPEPPGLFGISLLDLLSVKILLIIDANLFQNLCIFLLFIYF